MLIVSTLFFQASTHAEPANLTQLLSEIKTYHDSGTYEKELNQVVSQANAYILQRVQTNEKAVHPQKLAIVLDIDETCLTNYDKMVLRNFTGSKEQVKKEIQAANAPEIKPTLKLFQTALKNGVSVFFVTGRGESLRVATNKNLNNAGFKGYKGLFLRPESYEQTSIIPFKSNARAKITHMGYTIIASIGDQMSDLKGGFAEKTFKLPNPYYYLP